jgi:NADPH-dependent curcumin reductase CurA
MLANAPVNRRIVLVERPASGFEARHFGLMEAPAAEPGPGQFRVRLTHISLDPAMRGWVTAMRSYLPPVEIGETMRALGAGLVETSNHPDFPIGAAVSGLFGVQDYAISDGAGVEHLDAAAAPLQTWLGGLGMPGNTAYFGLLDVGQPKPGETVVVSAASGAVGQIVGQIAKIKGARAVGIAGGAAKCKALIDQFGYDAAVDYKDPAFAMNLKAACPNGVDVIFENVGGVVMDRTLALINKGARIALCGLISMYNAEQPVPLSNLVYVLRMSARIQGFIVFNYRDRYDEARAQMLDWYRTGQLRFVEDVREGGVAAFPSVVPLLYSGGNMGKLVLKV